MQRNLEIGLIAVCGLACMTLLFKNLSYPLLWQDEAETAVFATRILEYGFPKVHGDRNVVYEFGSTVTLGIDEATDAYIGTTWGHFYFAVPGVIAAAAAEDLNAKTWRVRLPFALCGALALGLAALAVTPVFRGCPERARRFLVVFWLLSCSSISLLLHLREARYYSLLILLVAAIGWIHLRHVVFKTLSYRRYAIALATLLVLLFNVFYTAFFIIGLLLGIEALWRALRAENTAGYEGEPTRPKSAGNGIPDGSIRRIAMSLAPLAVAGVCVIPLLVYFETFSIAAEFSKHVGFSIAVYLANVWNLMVHLSRHELLVVAVVGRMALLGVDRLGLEPSELWETLSRRVTSQLSYFALGYALLSCLNPLVYERYFIVLSPLLVVVFILDAMCLLALAKTRDRSRGGRLHAALLATIVVMTAATGMTRLDDLRGRLREISEPYRGPLDYVIPWIRENYPHPERLVIATNYENHPYIYYLGSHTIVGLSRNNIRRERMLEPDLVVPRRRWRASLGDAMAFVNRRKDEYRSHVFEVRDLHYNNVPALSTSMSTPDPHRFETALAGTKEQRLEVYVRIEPRAVP